MNIIFMFFQVMALLCLTFSPAWAAEKVDLYGVIDKIIDGDTVRVKFKDSSRLPKDYFKCSKVYKTMAWVHLLGIKSPDLRKKEHCAMEALNFGKLKALGREMRLEVNGCGPTGGLRAFVSHSEFGKKIFSLNYELVKAGLGWVSEDMSMFNSNDTYNKFLVAQTRASKMKLGLWGESTCAKR